MVVRPAPTRLSDFTDARRRSVRPAGARPPGFDELYDDDTLFYDSFRTSAGEVVLLGPPLHDLEPRVGAVRVAGATPEVQAFDRHRQLRLAPGAVGGDTAEVETGLGAFTVDVQPDESARFAGRRVLFTLSRDNPLPWVLDWVRFHRDVHGADAVLFYDNGSTAYAPEELQAALAGLDGIAVAVVVPWTFKYGPQGFDAVRHWDSDYCQLGAWEHARWRFLGRAASALNGDVDELVLAPGPGVFAIAERSPLGLARYVGRWVVDPAPPGPGPAEPDDRRHTDYSIVLRRRWTRGSLGPVPFPVDGERCRPKWTVVPRKVPAAAQWGVHRIIGWPASHLSLPGLSFRHFRPLSTGWKYDREDGGVFDPARHERDDRLLRAYDRVRWDR